MIASHFICILLLRQIMPIAAGLAAGPALEGFGAIGRMVSASAALAMAATRGGIALSRMADARRAPFTVAPQEASAPRASEVLSWRDPV